MEYIMEKHRSSSVEYVKELDPPERIKSIPRSNTLPKTISCNNCKKNCSFEKISPCERCGNGVYCSSECKFAHWTFHRKTCRDLGMVIKMKRKTI
ncbi:hypothetical protein SAMD00019534_055140 [Acytostelium subglobosum LB1]|uniref:hypothetical protein n=1 Tax=Acytostelium subglobosum LB1 TaxID=1410327 RepID=UPI000644F959|nr:hypothetical protein SAMD00019534_055140 [Acytostelium subglobosum LB1]GAM22339.1 hypothetical protein SAMD00019534_055140 [Acytostelium subglobosum LB1]|eukprot:XP_012754459.1 hypothetical protein SAMD00019534_055140 [Acytostelium subglobosum LB1]